ncbi:MAG: hypothetical protein NTX42_00890 [Methanothrix sp.]|nr:hypothetical protein [Methanothrix sp.]
MPPKIVSVELGTEQAIKQEIIPACRKRHLLGSRLSRCRSRDHRGERVGSEEWRTFMTDATFSIKHR